MALKRQRLSQRRKVVGLTQESLAQRLGVERSTVARWEAGATQPVPSMRPNVARALQVSIDQLAELLTESEDANTARALSVDTEGTIPVLPPKAQSEVWLERSEFENLIRPQVAETVEPFRSDHPGDIDDVGAIFGPDTPVPTTAKVGGFAGSDVREPARTQVPQRPSLTTVPLDVESADRQRRRGRSRRFTRFAAAGVLVLVGGAASVPLITSHSGSIAPAPVGNPALLAPVAASPAPDLGSSPPSENSTGAPAAAPSQRADGPAPPVAAAVRTPQTIRSTSRSRPPASVRTPPPPRAVIPAEAYAAWSRMAALSANDREKSRLRQEAPPHE
jgi:transcriptional regulator with XRE-family HTH domain